ncbi:MAG TPA: methyltransferase [Acidobacteriota bacterium]|nr:methyltransferase [Acidobacteriota bacterium]
MAKDELFGMMMGQVVAQAVFVAAELGLADLVASGRSTAREMAEAAGAHEQALYRLLRFLASHGVFCEGADGRFELTPKAELLRSDVEDSQRAAARMFGNCSQAMSHLLHSVKTQESGFVKAHGKPIFDHLAENPEEAAVFDAAMTCIHGGETDAVLDAYDFQSIGTLADIGGGNGSALTSALRRHSSLDGILFDQPHVIERAKPAMLANGVGERCRFVGGNFFEEIPSGADAYIMRHIIHDWYDEQAAQILRNCRRAIPADGRLLIVEAVVSDGNGPDPARLFDMVMLMVPGGLERDEAHYARLLRQSGFQLTDIVPTRSVVSVVEARPV